MIGRTLGHYEVVEKLGEGGMGAVYRARDTRLDRFVALKVLPAEKVADPDRKRRFEQEAKAASALNHPHIVTVYDIGTDDGADFIAMEHVVGRTLAEVIDRRGMPPARALELAVQIGDALSAAHEEGIVHRDLKPANVMVTDKGLVKVLDFGLAKLTEPSPAGPSALTESARPRTEQGVIVGTVAYMSPEQTEGLSVDARSDIFSFGVVLYEMVTGRRPFVGETGASTMAAILAKEPAPPSSLVGDLPFELERAILRCLRKEPDRRWQTMADLTVALRDVKDELDAGRLSAVVVSPARRARRTRLLAGALALLAVGAAAAGGAWLLRSKAEPASYEMERLTFDSAAALSPAISPDGSLIAYASDREGSFSLYLRQFGARQAIRLTDPESRDSFPCFSPDGLKILYRSEREGGGLWVRDALAGPGGAEMKLTDAGELAAYSPDGTMVAYLVPDALMPQAALFVVSAAGGVPHRLQPDLMATTPAAGIHQPPLWSPDGESLLVHGGRVGGPPVNTWWIVPVAGGEATRLEGVPEWPAWLGRFAKVWRGEHLYYSEGEPINGSILYRVRLLPRPWRVAGSPEKLASYAGVSTSASVSARGRMVFPSLAPMQNIWSVPRDAGTGVAAGPLEALTADSTGKRSLTLAADGTRLAYSSYGPPGQANVEVHVRDMTTGRESLIAGLGTWPFLDPVLSPDGSRVAYRDRREGKLVTFVAEAGSPSGRAVCEGCLVRAFFPGLEEVLVETEDGLVRRRLDGGAETPLVQVGGLGDAALSVDGQRLAFTLARPDGTAALYEADVARSPSPPSSWTLVAEDRRLLGSPAWSPDGRFLYFVSQRDGSPCVWVQPLAPDGRLAGAATAALHLHSGNGLWGQKTRVGVTAERVFVLATAVRGDIWSIELGE